MNSKENDNSINNNKWIYLDIMNKWRQIDEEQILKNKQGICYEQKPTSKERGDND